MSEKIKTNGVRNKSAGNGWELAIVNKLKSLGFGDLITTRNGSRSRDAQKIDIMYRDEYISGRLPYNIQAKNLSKPAPYPKLLSELPIIDGIINVIFHKQTAKNSAGRFMTRGMYAICNLDDFYSMMTKILVLEKYKKGYDILICYFDSIDEEEQKVVDKQLKELGL